MAIFIRMAVNAGQVGLVFKNKKLISVYQEGTHWFLGDKDVMLYNMSAPFTPPVELNMLLQHEALVALLDVVEVADNEIALQFVNGNFKEVLLPGRYAFWKGVVQNTFVKADISKPEITEAIPAMLFENPKLRHAVRKFQVQAYEKALLYIAGVFVKELASGTYYFWNNAITVEVKTVDIRQQQLEISGQELLTKDKAAIRINFFARYQVTNIVKALTDNKDFEKQLYVIMQLAIRAFTGGYTLDELLARKETVAKEILENVEDKITNLGLSVSDAGIRDVILPGDMKEIMNQVLVAEKKAQANSIMRREETAATRSLLNTAKLMEENEMLWKLKEMEYVEKIADRIGEITISGGGNIIGQLKEIFVK
ncbi:peptidase [Flavobacterium akiainvivens]|uniref:Peptidase n=1 Tax=Flavobacterium akiainvivens TaxID=1202724 RepID=A0A0M9VHL9_9FLAO|nr:slipin family protein [Flavobacterium akiainvivens]KOS05710.1 peptidase [Flavobacterium akiainvivens]SFQ37066.1 SPFH domain / Band 7 family protein [Flavobacterium akiainvivens]